VPEVVVHFPEGSSPAAVAPSRMPAPSCGQRRSGGQNLRRLIDGGPTAAASTPITRVAAGSSEIRPANTRVRPARNQTSVVQPSPARQNCHSGVPSTTDPRTGTSAHIGGYFAAQNARRGAAAQPRFGRLPQPLTEVRVTDREPQARMLAGHGSRGFRGSVRKASPKSDAAGRRAVTR